jgi:hypothetical protein
LPPRAATGTAITSVMENIPVPEKEDPAARPRGQSPTLGGSQRDQCRSHLSDDAMKLPDERHGVKEYIPVYSLLDENVRADRGSCGRGRI